MVRIVPRQEHDGILTFEEGVDAVRSGYEDRASYPSRLIDEPRHRLFNPNSGVRLSNHFGIAPDAGGAGILLHTQKPESDTERQEYGFQREAESIYAVYDEESGELQGILLGDLGGKEFPMKGNRAFATALESTVGTDVLARDDASILGILGSGYLAQNHIVAFEEIRDFEEARVYSPTKSHREAFKEEVDDVVDCDIEVVDDTESAVEGVDVLLCATNASEPVFDGDLLEPGQHVTSVVGSDVELVKAGYSPKIRREIDDRTVARADVYAANSVRQAQQNEQGDFAVPIENGVIDWDDVVSLPDIIGGEHRGREKDEQITVYKQNSIQGVTQMALANLALERAEEENIGIDMATYEVRKTDRF